MAPWQQRYEYVDARGGDEEAAMLWVEAVLGRAFPRPLPAALKTGSPLCELINKLKPGSVASKFEAPTDKAFEQRARVDE